jgi:hypothetical protein
MEIDMEMERRIDQCDNFEAGLFADAFAIGVSNITHKPLSPRDIDLLRWALSVFVIRNDSKVKDVDKLLKGYMNEYGVNRLVLTWTGASPCSRLMKLDKFVVDPKAYGVILEMTYVVDATGETWWTHHSFEIINEKNTRRRSIHSINSLTSMSSMSSMSSIGSIGSMSRTSSGSSDISSSGRSVSSCRPRWAF